MSELYILDGFYPIRCDDPARWARWMAVSDRRVATDEIGLLTVRTVFLGMNIGFSKNPRLFETTLIDEPDETIVGCCATWDAALIMHHEARTLAHTLLARSDAMLDAALRRWAA